MAKSLDETNNQMLAGKAPRGGSVKVSPPGEAHLPVNAVGLYHTAPPRVLASNA